MTKRRKYSTEFKREAVEQTRQPGVSCRQVALEIGVNPNMLSRWKRELEEAPGSAHKGSRWRWQSGNVLRRHRQYCIRIVERNLPAAIINGT